MLCKRVATTKRGVPSVFRKFEYCAHAMREPFQVFRRFRARHAALRRHAVRPPDVRDRRRVTGRDRGVRVLATRAPRRAHRAADGAPTGVGTRRAAGPTSHPIPLGIPSARKDCTASSSRSERDCDMREDIAQHNLFDRSFQMIPGTERHRTSDLSLKSELQAQLNDTWIAG
jgi:hypothetical protein